jgi:hypothetical protein
VHVQSGKHAVVDCTMMHGVCGLGYKEHPGKRNVGFTCHSVPAAFTHRYLQIIFKMICKLQIT